MIECTIWIGGMSSLGFTPNILYNSVLMLHFTDAWWFVWVIVRLGEFFFLRNEQRYILAGVSNGPSKWDAPCRQSLLHIRGRKNARINAPGDTRVFFGYWQPPVAWLKAQLKSRKGIGQSQYWGTPSYMQTTTSAQSMFSNSPLSIPKIWYIRRHPKGIVVVS